MSARAQPARGGVAAGGLWVMPRDQSCTLGASHHLTLLMFSLLKPGPGSRTVKDLIALCNCLWQGQAELSGLKEAIFHLVVVSEWLTRSNSMALPGAVEMHKSVAVCPYSHPVQGSSEFSWAISYSHLQEKRA